MSVLLYLVPTALGLGLIGLFGFMWSMRSGQYDDMEGAANRILKDDDLQDPQERPAASELKGH